MDAARGAPAASPSSSSAAGADTYKVRAFRGPPRPSPTCRRRAGRAWPSPAASRASPASGSRRPRSSAEALDGRVPELPGHARGRATADDLELDARRPRAPRVAAGGLPRPLRLVGRRQPIREMAEAARAHRPRLPGPHRPQRAPDRRPRPRTPSGCGPQLDVVAELNEELAPFRILTGIEVDILEDGSLDQDAGPAGRARRGGGQRALQAPHGAPEMTETDARRRREPAHRHPGPLHRPPHRRARAGPRPTFDAEAVFAAARRTGTAVEINSRPERQDPPQDLLAPGASSSAARSASTPTPTRRASSSGCRGCEQGGRRRGAIRSGSSTAGSVDDLLAWTAARMRGWTRGDAPRPAPGGTRCWPSSPASCPAATGSSTSRNGTASAASSSATAATSSWAAATRSH